MSAISDLTHLVPRAVQYGVPSLPSDPYESRSHQVIVTAVIMFTLSTLVIVMRFISRVKYCGGARTDDWVILMAWISLAVFTCLTLVSVSDGFGQHIWTLQPEHILKLAKQFWISAFFYAFTLFFVKAAILLLYSRIFNPHREISVFGVTLALISLISFAHVTMAIVGAVFQCDATLVIFHHTLTKSCLSSSRLYVATGSLNLISDVGLFLCPLPAIYSLKIRKRQRLGLYFTFSLGAVVIVASSIRLAVLLKQVFLLDFTYAPATTAIWALIETNLALICASLPPSKALFQRVFPSMLNSTQRGSSGNYTGSATGKHVKSRLTEPARNTGSYVSELPTVVADDRSEETLEAGFWQGISKTVNFSISEESGPKRGHQRAGPSEVSEKALV